MKNTACCAAGAALATAALHGCTYIPFLNDEPASRARDEAPAISTTISGVDDEVAATVRAHLKVEDKPCTIGAAYFGAITSETESEAAAALQAFGYYAPEIEVSTAFVEPCPTVSVAVEPGPPVLIERVEIDLAGAARDDPSFERAVAGFPLTPGEPLHHGRYKSAKSRLESLASERGYLDARFSTARLFVTPATERAVIDWVFESGDRYRLGAVTVDQEPVVLNPGLLDRLLEYEEGKPYSVKEVSRLNRALAQSGYFSRIDVRPRLRSSPEKTIPVDISLSPKNRHAVTAGVGFSTDERLRFRANYTNRRLNRAGHRLSTGFKTSFIEQTFSTEYQIPRRYPLDEWLTFQAGVRNETVESFDATSFQVSVLDTKRRPWGWFETRFVQIERSDFEIGRQSGTALFLTPGVRFRKSVADNDLFPRRGYSLNIELLGASDAVLSDTDFAQVSLAGTYINPMPWDARLLLRTRLGATWVDEFAALTPAQRFFTGGDNTVRGYEFESLGPINEDREAIGGIYLGVISVEYEHPLTEKFGLAAFVDTGNAFGGDGRDDGLKTSVGLGLRWRSPVGPVRLDLAHPFDVDKFIVFHLRIGPDL